MIDTLQILAIMLISIAMAPVLAHAFEYPGKMRLTREDYVTVQAIYYPGFTIAGASEPAGVVAVLLLLLVTPAGTPEFWLTLAALIGVLGMQAIYWAFIHPTNGFWLRSAKTAVGSVGGGFFGVVKEGRPAGSAGAGDMDWRKVRNRWEHSHIARAGLAFLSLLSLVLAIA